MLAGVATIGALMCFGVAAMTILNSNQFAWNVERPYELLEGKFLFFIFYIIYKYNIMMHMSQLNPPLLLFMNSDF